MRRSRLRFVWKSREAIAGEWRLGVWCSYRDGSGSRGLGRAISVRGVLRWLGALGLAAYLGGATALFWFWEKNPYNRLTYVDAAFYPLRRGVIADRRAQAFIAQGLDLARAGKWQDAEPLLRLGLARRPQELMARMKLVEFNVGTRQRGNAWRLLEEGLNPAAFDRRYVTSVFMFAAAGDDFEPIIRWSRHYLPKVAGDRAVFDRAWLADQLFGALLGAARFAEALALAEGESPGDKSTERRGLALIGLGRAADAVAWLEGSRTRGEGSAPLISRLLVRAYREAGRLDDMEKELANFRALEPAQPGPLVYRVVQLAMAGRREAARRAFDDYVFRFGGKQENLTLVAAPLAEIGEPDLVGRCVAAAAERGWPRPALDALHVEAALAAGDWETAQRAFAAATRSGPANPWRERTQRVLAAIKSPVDGAQAQLLEVLRRRHWRLVDLKHDAEILRRAGEVATARDIALLAQQTFPASPWPAKLLAAIEEKRSVAADQAAAAPVVAAVPVAAAPQGDEFFTRLDEALQRGHVTEADRLIRGAKALAPKPAWLVRREADFYFAQIRLAQARGESAALIQAARLFLDRRADRGPRLLAFARELHAAG
ncbi:MAG: hypothetical protein RLZZ15_1799, partial [Verrucomicrobiota bacterium]